MAGDFVKRLQRTVFSLLLGLCRRKVSSEVVLVEWRPPNNTKGLRSLAFSWIADELQRRRVGLPHFDCPLEALPTLRVITVSDKDADDALRSVGQQEHKGMLEWSCKSVGLRRALGDALLTINADDMPSPALFDFLAHVRRLRRDTFYLAQTLGVWFMEPSEHMLYHRVYKDVFRRVSDEAEREAREAEADRPEVAFSRSQRLCERPSDFWADAGVHAKGLWRSYDETCRLDVNKSGEDGLPRYFYDLYVGDFMLASRVAWQRISGAPMLPQSVAIDWLVSCRFATRLRQVVLMAPCFNAHQNHPHSMTIKKRRVDAGRQRELAGPDMWRRCRRPLGPLPSERGVLRRQWGFPRRAFPEVQFVPDPGSGRITAVRYVAK